MGVEANWLANLRALVDQEAPGKNKRAGFRAVADATGMSEEYIYQLYEAKPKADGRPRVVGRTAARKVAEAFAAGRPLEWFDQPPAGQAAVVAPVLTPHALEIAQLLDSIADHGQFRAAYMALHDALRPFLSPTPAPTLPPAGAPTRLPHRVK